MDQLLLELLNRLEDIGNRDESIYDTVVREKMSEPIFYAFVKPQPGYIVPDDYEMPEEENRLIKAALQSYIEDANALARTLELNTFHKRLAAFQNGEVKSNQSNYYDDFFGWWNPAWFDESGNVIGRK